MRRKLLVGNWKMHGTTAESVRLARRIAELVGSYGAAVDVALAPAFPSLAAVRAALAGTGIEVAAQDMHWAEEGAYTGAVAPPMVVEHASRVILGHSERRQLFGETDLDVHRKVHAAFDHGLLPIVCVGETAEERDSGNTDDVVRRQVALATDGLRAVEACRLVIAYEPVWAIGSGRACEAGEAARVAAAIRGDFARANGRVAGEDVRILYGGSVNPGNVRTFLAWPGVDGALVGGASLDADTFAALVQSGFAAGGRAIEAE